MKFSMSLPLLIALGIVLFFVGFLFLRYWLTWLKATLSGAPVGFTTLIAMWLRGVPYIRLVDARITAVKAGIEISTDLLEAHHLAEGSVLETVQASSPPLKKQALASTGNVRAPSTWLLKAQTKACWKRCALPLTPKSSTAPPPPREK